MSLLIGCSTDKALNVEKIKETPKAESIIEADDKIVNTEDTTMVKPKDTKESTLPTAASSNEQTKIPKGEGGISTTTPIEEKLQKDVKEDELSAVAQAPKDTVSLKITGVNEDFYNSEVELNEGMTAYSVLKNIDGIEIECHGSGKYVYVTGINGLMEKQHGAMSGWLYTVNGEKPNKSASAYVVESGDKVVWYYANY